jgi:hypothetical protein
VALNGSVQGSVFVRRSNSKAALLNDLESVYSSKFAPWSLRTTSICRLASHSKSGDDIIGNWIHIQSRPLSNPASQPKSIPERLPRASQSGTSTVVGSTPSLPCDRTIFPPSCHRPGFPANHSSNETATTLSCLSQPVLPPVPLAGLTNILEVLRAGCSYPVAPYRVQPLESPLLNFTANIISPRPLFNHFCPTRQANIYGVIILMWYSTRICSGSFARGVAPESEVCSGIPSVLRASAFGLKRNGKDLIQIPHYKPTYAPPRTIFTPSSILLASLFYPLCERCLRARKGERPRGFWCNIA